MIFIMERVLNAPILKVIETYQIATVKQGNFDRSGSFVKDATVLNQERIFVASAFMEMND